VYGHVSEQRKRELYQRAWLNITASSAEGWGLSVMEAAACGTPSIGYDVPGLRDSVLASGGALVEPTPEAMSSALSDFFAGRLRLEPRPSTVPWPEVTSVIEARLEKAIR